MKNSNMRNSFPLKCRPCYPPPDRLSRTTWGELFPTPYTDGRCSRLVPGACAVTPHPHSFPHPHRAPALSPGFAAAAGIGHPGAGGHSGAMAEGEDMQTFTSIMDALVRISVS
jgi:hypothetical protein